MSATDPPGWEADLRRALRTARPSEVGPGVLGFDFDLGLLPEHIDAHFDSRAPGEAPNSLNRHGQALAGPGFEGVGAIVVEELLEPLRARHFAEACPRPLDADYAYLVEYGDHGDLDLSLHVDASHVTLNLCLGDWFEGGELVMEGVRCEGHRERPPRAEELVALEHAPGRAFVHLGAHRHRVTPVSLGRRRNLIVWARHEGDPSLGGNGPCGPWCGAHRGR
jgi:hypothetical protein